jgi:hypothetical protein
MKLSGKYTIAIRGDTDKARTTGRSTSAIGYLMHRLLTGESAAVESELAYWGITVERTDKPFIRLTPEDVELMLADSFIPALGDMDLTELTEFANLVADKLLGVAEDVYPSFSETGRNEG